MTPSWLVDATLAVAGAFATYLLVLAVVAAALRAAGSLDGWERALQAVPAPFRRLVAALASAATMLVAAPAAAETADGPPAPPAFSLRALDDAGSPMATSVPGPVAAAPAAPLTTTVPVVGQAGDAGAPSADAGPAVADAAAPAPMLATPDAGTTPPAASPATPTTWVVAPGDHLWSIAERTLAAAGRATGDADVAPYWLAVVAANEDLADPDLLRPGQVVALPPLA